MNSVGVGYPRTDLTAALLEVPHNLEHNLSRTALGRIGEVEDIADAVAFLASDDARWIAGTQLDVSGGVGR
ncbi:MULTISPECIES: SDR family oxidoreductase [Amycolatopsis]|uniref:SDR family oxidoreductase n=1 Tax=Amycolatopsis TaxID=1813 RepID=UPI002104244F|nr:MULTISPECIES: SDR family oxidoreductase [Amycolatopsis]